MSSLILPDCVVVDISHWQPRGSIDWKSAHDQGNVRGAIVKLMQNGAPDPEHVGHLYDAYEAGVELLGIYDFGTESEDHVAFLKEALTEFGGNVEKRLLVLDAEHNPSSQMTVADMEAWASGVHESQGRWPTVYTGRYGPDGAGTGLPSKVLSNCSLWLPAYGPHESNLGSILPPGFRVPVNDTESAGVVRLWQWTGDGINAGSDWPVGIPGKNDLSYLIGFSSFEAAQAWWGS